MDTTMDTTTPARREQFAHRIREIMAGDTLTPQERIAVRTLHEEWGFAPKRGFRGESRDSAYDFN